MADSDVSQHLVPYISMASNGLQDADRLINKIASNKGANRPKDFADKILSVTNMAILVFEGLAQLHPIASVVVAEFKALVQLETSRRESDDGIVLVFHEMTISFSALNPLAKILHVDSVRDSLERPLGELHKTMNNFGNFASLYYSEKRIGMSTSLIRFFEVTALREVNPVPSTG